jgi:hypothetical protein
MLRRVSTFGIALLLLMPALTAQQRAPHNESITQVDMRADLFFLAGDSMRGRLTDTDENRATADYLRSRFERMGLKPAGRTGRYFQPYNLMTATLGEGNGLDIITGDAATRHLAVGQEFYPQRVSASGRVSAPVTFVGFGISAPHLQHDDYNGDVTGKIRPRARSRAWRARREQPVRRRRDVRASTLWRKVVAAQDKARWPFYS